MNTKIKVMHRIAYITRLLRGKGLTDISLKELKIRKSSFDGYYKLVAVRDNARIFITELLLDGNIVKYSYTLIIDNEVILRYDNAPHHREIATYPHHKHVSGRVEPLTNYSIENFLDEIDHILK